MITQGSPGEKSEDLSWNIVLVLTITFWMFFLLK